MNQEPVFNPEVRKSTGRYDFDGYANGSSERFARTASAQFYVEVVIQVT